MELVLCEGLFMLEAGVERSDGRGGEGGRMDLDPSLLGEMRPYRALSTTNNRWHLA